MAKAKLLDGKSLDAKAVAAFKYPKFKGVDQLVLTGDGFVFERRDDAISWARTKKIDFITYDRDKLKGE